MQLSASPALPGPPSSSSIVPSSASNNISSINSAPNPQSGAPSKASSNHAFTPLIRTRTTNLAFTTYTTHRAPTLIPKTKPQRKTMVKFYETTHTHPHPFPTVTLAYFLRYPNPYSTHVLSTDVLSRHFDPLTQRLYTARLHLKRSKVPPILLKLLPRNLIGGAAADTGSSQSLVLERSWIDVRNGVMSTESENLEFRGVLAVRERQVYKRPGVDLSAYLREEGRLRRGLGWLGRGGGGGGAANAGVDVGVGGRGGGEEGETHVSTRVEIESRLGQARERIRRNRAAAKADTSSSSSSSSEDDAPPKPGFFKTWGTSSIQKTIESVGMRRTERAVPKSKDGMNVVLARLRGGGLTGVFEGMRRDREGLGSES